MEFFFSRSMFSKFINSNSWPRIHTDHTDLCHSERSEEPVHFVGGGRLHRSFFPLRTTNQFVIRADPCKSAAKACSPSGYSDPHNHKTRAPTSARTTQPSPSASAAEAKQTAAP